MQQVFAVFKCIYYYIFTFNIFIGSDFVTMIQIDCAVTDTKTLHIRDTHLRHNNVFKSNDTSNLKQHDGIKIYNVIYHFCLKN